MKASFTAAHLEDTVVEKGRTDLREYLDALRSVRDSGAYDAPESSINLPSDDERIDRALSLAQEKGASAKTVLVIGIGGSNLGAEALYQALRSVREVKEMLFIETVDEELLRATQSVFDRIERLEDLLVCVISKSGKTTETVANADIVLAELYARFGSDADVLSRFVVITDAGSALSRVAEERGIAQLNIPHTVGGRYSVFSSVGLFPLAAAGVDVREICRGARELRDFILEGSGEPAVSSAVFLAHHSKRGYNIHDTFLFDPKLEKLGGWYRQLLGESIGKRENRKGEDVRTGITPTVSIGSRDLHSVGQLSLDGPRDKMTTFVVRSAQKSDPLRVPQSGLFSASVPEVGGKSTSEILAALAEGAIGAYREAGLPFVAAYFEEGKSVEYDLGAFMQWKMIETMLLGALLDINPFDQGAVESFKTQTRDLLEKK